jgi:hypothetical protein
MEAILSLSACTPCLAKREETIYGLRHEAQRCRYCRASRVFSPTYGRHGGFGPRVESGPLAKKARKLFCKLPTSATICPCPCSCERLEPGRLELTRSGGHFNLTKGGVRPGYLHLAYLAGFCTGNRVAGFPNQLALPAHRAFDTFDACSLFIILIVFVLQIDSPGFRVGQNDNSRTSAGARPAE